MDLLETCKPGIKYDVCVAKIKSDDFVVNFEQPIGILLVGEKKQKTKQNKTNEAKIINDYHDPS